jgi:uncharacterized protein (TIGR04222 family)
MTFRNDPLCCRISGFTFDEGTPALTFADRLARENGWSKAYTGRVLREYRRFLYLTQVADHMVVPSEEVDQAWHLHLTYTRSYWDRLCGEVLGQPLHHHPTQGGAAESRKFVDLYARTLATYRAVFGEQPPPDIWPDAAVRFGGEWRQVNLRNYWLLRKPRLRVPQAAFAVLPFTAALPLEFYPFTLHGTEFFGFYLPAYAATFVLALSLRRVWSKSSPTTNAADPTLDAAETAYLAGGTSASVNTALASLVARRVVVLDEEKKFRLAGDVPNKLTALEQAVCQSVENRTAAKASEIRTDVADTCDEIDNRLIEHGLLVDDDHRTLALIAPLFLAMAVPTLGLVRLGIGIWSGRPVGFLVAVLVVTAVLSLIVFARKPFRSSRGTALLRQLRTDNGRLQRAGASDTCVPDVAMGVALFGVGALAGGEFEQLRKSLARPTVESSYSSGCGGGCSGGGGCGGGGCGGGCGGCGG